MEQKHLTISLAKETILFALFSGVLLWLFYYLRTLVFLVLTAIVISSAIEPIAGMLARRKIPRVLSVSGIYLGGLALLFGIGYYLAPPVLKETKVFFANLPAYAQALGIGTQPQSSGFLGALGQFHLEDAIQNIETNLAQTAQEGAGFVASIFGGLVSFGLIIVLSFYFSIRETGIDDFLRIVVPANRADYAVRLWRRAQHKIGRWLQGQILLSLFVGALIAVGLFLLGVRQALLLGMLAAVLEVVPIFGSTFSAIPALALAFVDGGVSLALVVLGLYVVVNQFESHVVYPLVVQKIVDVPPVLIIISLLAGAQLAGIYGIILSVPIAALVREYIADVQKGRRGDGAPHAS